MAIFKVKGEIIDSATENAGERICEILLEGANANLRNWINGRRRDMSQAITKIENGEGKPTADYLYHRLPVQHASAGVAARAGNISIFYVVGSGAVGGIRVLGVGEHTSSTSYRLAWKDVAWTSCSGMIINL